MRICIDWLLNDWTTLTLQKPYVVEEEEDDFEEPEEEEDEIIESDIEFEGETVEPDNDPPQKVCPYFCHPSFWFVISDFVFFS